MQQAGESEKRHEAGSAAGESVGLAIAYSCITCSWREDLPLGDASPMLVITRRSIGVTISYFVPVHYLGRYPGCHVRLPYLSMALPPSSEPTWQITRTLSRMTEVPRLSKNRPMSPSCKGASAVWTSRFHHRHTRYRVSFQL